MSRATNDAIWDWDLVTDLVWWSDSFNTSLGCTPGVSPAASDAWAERIHPDDYDRVLGGLRRAIASGERMWHDEYRLRRDDGTYADVLDRGYILHDGTGRPVRMVGGMNDDSERKQLEAQFHGAQRLENIGLLAGGVAHDLNNVLAPVFMAITLLRNDVTGAANLNLLDLIESSTQRGAALVQQILSFARGTEGRRVALDPSRLLTDVATLATETFPRAIQIITEVAANLWPVSGQLHQVLLNLAVNARDAMPARGTLTFCARNVSLDAVHVAYSQTRAGDYVLIEVIDTGVGIAPEIRSRIFEPFFTTKESGKGTGLGLANVQAIVRNHAGSLTVYSEPGRGHHVQSLSAGGP